ncbi:MAG: carbon storage regulator [Gemmataceae bacterium]|nr:carbon storage regulator [Gemmataceae bacterium]
MLVLTRRTNESIQIGHDIVLTVVSIDRGRIRLGIEAPPQVPIARQELAARLRSPRIQRRVAIHDS